MNKNIRSYICNIILWILVIGYYFIITSFSTTSAAKSKAESQAVVDIVEYIYGAVLHKSCDDGMTFITGKLFHKMVRKVAHILNFFILGFLHGMLFFSYSRKRLITVLLTFGMGFLGAVIDEITQLFIKGRSAQVSDIFVDFSGTVLGCMLFLLLYRITLSRLERRYRYEKN